MKESRRHVLFFKSYNLIQYKKENKKTNLQINYYISHSSFDLIKDISESGFQESLLGPA